MEDAGKHAVGDMLGTLAAMPVTRQVDGILRCKSAKDLLQNLENNLGDKVKVHKFMNLRSASACTHWQQLGHRSWADGAAAPHPSAHLWFQARLVVLHTAFLACFVPLPPGDVIQLSKTIKTDPFRAVWGSRQLWGCLGPSMAL